MKKIPLIGPHVSISEGLDMALLVGRAMGATTIQIFTANQRSWSSKKLTDEEIALFRETLKKTGLRSIMSHSSYLINLGSPRTDVRTKSLKAFREEIERCLALGITFLNFHPGSALDSPREDCLNAIIDALLSYEDLVPKGSALTLLLETMAGQGSTVGARFEGLGSHKDRHRLIGEGMIGKEGFSAIMREPRLSPLPKYLETPGDLDIWQGEIAWLMQISMKG